MRHARWIGTAGFVLFAAGPAMAACPEDISKLRSELHADQGFQQRHKQGQIDELAYRALFDAAQTFADKGLEQPCQNVLAGLRDLSKKADAQESGPRGAERQERQGPPPVSGEGPGGMRVPGDTTRRPQDSVGPGGMRPPGERGPDRFAVLRGAKPIADAAISADRLIRADIRNTQDRDLGEVSDVLMQRGRITEMIIGRGGFLGVGTTHYRVDVEQVKIVVPMDALMRAPDSITGRSRQIVVLDMSEQQVEALPQVKKQNGRWVAAEDSDERQNDGPPTKAPGAPPSGSNPRQ